MNTYFFVALKACFFQKKPEYLEHQLLAFITISYCNLLLNNFHLHSTCLQTGISPFVQQ